MPIHHHFTLAQFQSAGKCCFKNLELSIQSEVYAAISHETPRSRTDPLQSPQPGANAVLLACGEPQRSSTASELCSAPGHILQEKIFHHRQNLSNSRKKCPPLPGSHS